MKFRWIVYLLLITDIAIAQASLKLEDSKQNFGFVKQGKKVSLHFKFKNTGNQPLIIHEYKVACSCTSVEFPKTPIAPLQESEIVVHFDTNTVYDRQDRVVELFSNDPSSPAKIRFKGVVLRK